MLMAWSHAAAFARAVADGFHTPPAHSPPLASVAGTSLSSVRLFCVAFRFAGRRPWSPSVVSASAYSSTPSEDLTAFVLMTICV